MKQTKKQGKNPLRWLSPALLVTAAVFSSFGHTAALVPDQYGPSFGWEGPCFPFQPCDPPPENNPPPPPISSQVLQPPNPPITILPAPVSPSDQALPSFSPPPFQAPDPPGPVTLPVPRFGGNNGEGQQQRGESQKKQRSKPIVAATVGWVFLAAALLLQVALGGFLAYKRWELERYRVRLEQVSAGRASPPRRTGTLPSDYVP